jgi:hypothetical protein
MESELKYDQSLVELSMLIKQFGGLYGLAPMPLDFGRLANVWR